MLEANGTGECHPHLAINARDAMQGEGTIELSAENVALDHTFCAGKGITAGDYVRVAVADTGTGMAALTHMVRTVLNG